MTDPNFDREAAEHDLAEQLTPVIDNPDDEAEQLLPKESRPQPEADEADWLEQQLPVPEDPLEEYPPEDVEPA